jgi:hypothetical protein
MHQNSMETARKISKSFVNYPHLRLAVAALLVAGDDKALNCGDVAQFEAWVFVNPKVTADLGDCRSFLKRVCPIRYWHTQISNDWEKVVSFFPQADALLRALPPEVEAVETPYICIDPNHFVQRGRRPGKRAMAIATDAADTIALTLRELGVEARVLSANAYADCKEYYVGIMAQVSPAAVLTVEASAIPNRDFAWAVAEALDEQGLSVAPGEHGPFQIVDEWISERYIAVILPFSSGASDEYAEAERAVAVGQAIAKAVRA